MSVYLWASGTVPVAWPDPDADGYETETIFLNGAKRSVDGALHVDYAPTNRHRWTMRWSAISGVIGTAISWWQTYGVILESTGPVSFIGLGYHSGATYTVQVVEANYHKVSPGAWGAEMVLEEY